MLGSFALGLGIGFSGAGSGVRGLVNTGRPTPLVWRSPFWELAVERIQ